MKTNNPGPWFLHCHINWHFAAGFAVVMAEDIPGIAAANPAPGKFRLCDVVLQPSHNIIAAWRDLCPKYNALSPGDL